MYAFFIQILGADVLLVSTTNVWRRTAYAISTVPGVMNTDPIARIFFYRESSLSCFSFLSSPSPFYSSLLASHLLPHGLRLYKTTAREGPSDFEVVTLSW